GESGGAPGPRPRRAAAARAGAGAGGATGRGGVPAGGGCRRGRAAARRRRARGASGRGNAVRRAANGWVLPVSVLLAILLGLVPLPAVLQPLRPYWLALVVAYWVIEDNEHLGLVFAFSMGLLADLAFGSIL